MISRILSVIDTASKIAGAFAAMMFVAIAVLILAEVVMRSAFDISLVFAWEYSTYLTAGGILCGAAFTLRSGGHVRVSLLSANVPPGAARAVDVVCTLFAIWIAAVLAYSMTEFALRSLLAGSTSPTVVAMPLVIPQSVVALGAVLLLLQLVARLVRLFVGEAPEDASAQKSFGVD